jgi:NAD(P)-dependent dehydrogenase (short-subunit alcohol dehydrogenase family)
MDEFQDRVMLVTGAGRGLGLAVAKALAERGAIVAANDINPLSLDELVAQCTALGGRVRAYCFDVAKRMPVMALMAQVLEDWGRIDGVVINAAVEPEAALLEMDEWDWHHTVDVNLSGAFFVIQQAARAMRQAGGGVIVAIGANPAYANQWRGAYMASKAGLLGLVAEAAHELAGDQIRVHAVCPHPVSAQDGQVFAEDVEQVVFLCSQEAADLTGKVFNASSE